MNGSVYFKRNIGYVIISFNFREKFKADFTQKNTIANDFRRYRKYRASYIDTIFQENLIGSRFKSEDSIRRSMRKLLEQVVDLNNVLMMFWVSV